jgi:hypothetical protein
VRAAVRDSEFAAVGKTKPRALYIAAAALVAGVAIGVALQWAWMAKPEAPVVQVPVFEVKPEAPPPSHLNPDQARRIEGYAPSGQPLLSERIAATRDLLKRAPDGGYSIELFITDQSDPARMERFLLRARELVPIGELFVIPTAGASSRYRLRVMYGEFGSAEDAAAAGKRLPPRYQQAFRTSVRSFGELRSQI